MTARTAALRASSSRALLPESADATQLLSSFGLRYAAGGSNIGEDEATKLLTASFADLHDSVLALTGEYRGAQRVVLWRDEKVVAAAVLQVHADSSVLEVPIFAASKTARRKGHGAVLTALLIGLGRRLGLRTLVISATDESRAFWVKQGLHSASFCRHAEKAALRALRTSGLVHAFANSTLMAMPIGPTAAGAADDDGASRATIFGELRAALDRCGSSRGRLPRTF